MDKYIGKRLDGRYEIRELIGVGGMAYVYCAYDSIDEREVAVKILKDEYLSNEEFTRRFKNESKAIAILSHPNIVKVLDVSFGERIQYIVMEYIDGISLKEYIEQQRVTWQEAVYFVQQILRALQHAHDKGIVHRDIKPQNIMLLADGTIKVTDFGIARFSRTDVRTGHGDKAIGSVHYISPEQARGALTDEKSDIYSVGVMLYEMLTGCLPFEADNAVSVAIMQLQSQAKKPTEINPDIPEGLEEITLKAMQKNPEKRYQSAAEMLQDIQEFKQNPSIHFAYTYLTDENPTRYVDAITSIKGTQRRAPANAVVTEQEKKKFLFTKPFWLTVAAGAILLVLVIFGILAISNNWLFGGGSKDTLVVPNFVGKKYDELAADNFKDFADVSLEYEYNNDYGKGYVVAQDPMANKHVKAKTKVLTLTISKGAQEIKLPEINGNQTEAQIMSRLKSLLLEPQKMEASSDEVPEGNVIKITPADTPVVKGTVVYVYVSTGIKVPDPVTVDNVVGSKKENAVKRLTEQGFAVRDSAITKKNSEKPAGTVLSQSPEAGTSLDPGTEISLVISSGYRDVQVALPLPDVDCAVDLKVYVDGSYSEEYSADLKGLLPADLGVKTLTFTEVTGKKYTVTVQIAAAGSENYSLYYKYSVDPKAGKAAVIEKHSFTAPPKTTEPPAPTNPPENSEALDVSDVSDAGDNPDAENSSAGEVSEGGMVYEFDE